MRIKKLKPGFQKLTKEKARVIAHLIGDGAHYQTKHDYVLKYEVSDEESLNQFNDDIIKVYGLKPSWEKNFSKMTKKHLNFIRLRSKLAFEDLLNYSTYYSVDWKLKSLILNSPLYIKKEFIKAFADDEGSVVPEGKKGVIKLYSINKDGLKQIQTMLKEFNIKSIIYSGYGLKRNVYAIIIKDIKMFHEKIGFNLKRKINKLNSLINK